MNEELFYLRDSRGNIGSNLTFWAVGGSYTTNLNKAELFTRERAEAQHLCRHTDVPLLKAMIDEKARPVVDMQYMRRDRANASGGEFCYVQVDGEWDGNDAFFVSQRGGASTNLNLASVWPAHEALCATMRNDGWRAWPKSFIDGLRRIAVSENDLDLPGIIRAGGIPIQKHPRIRKEVSNCCRCGSFLSESQIYTGCPKCGTDENRP